MKDFLNLIEHHLQRRDWHRQELLANAQISKRTWSRWQAGINTPQRASTQRIVKALNLSSREAAQLEAALLASSSRGSVARVSELEERVAGLEARIDRVDRMVSRIARAAQVR